MCVRSHLKDLFLYLFLMGRKLNRKEAATQHREYTNEINIHISLCGLGTRENTVGFDKTIRSKQAGISSPIPDPFLLHFSCPFDPPDTLSYRCAADREQPQRAEWKIWGLFYTPRGRREKQGGGGGGEE